MTQDTSRDKRDVDEPRFPVLRAIIDEFEETNETPIGPWELQQRTGFDDETVQKALQAKVTRSSYLRRKSSW
jgi:hypothetical protein